MMNMAKFAIAYVRPGDQPEQWMGIVDGEDKVTTLKEAIIQFVTPALNKTKEEVTRELNALTTEDQIWVYADEHKFHLMACVI
jgi:uncharacterized protein YchJ